MTLVPGFTGSPLDRRDAIRHDAGALAAFAADPRALLLDLDNYEPHTGAAGELGWIPLPPLPDDERIFLGTLGDRPRFVRLDPQAPAARRTESLMAIIEALPAGEAATYAAARSLLDWHARHRFCANCGFATVPIRAGWARQCPNCGTEHFPRTDPVVIMLAQRGAGEEAEVLVGRQAAFPPGRYSALAGFVEVGESLEEAVRREIGEEAGIRVGAVRYLASQPWPFPSQLMIACVADAESDAIILDAQELEDAKWVTRAQVRAALARTDGAAFLPPPSYAIAHTLFSLWLEQHKQ
jgi:NAD+ diphosphatase